MYNMELGIMVLTQLSLDFSLPATLMFVVRKRIFSEIPVLKKATSHLPLFGEIQLIADSSATDEEVIKGANKLLDFMVDENLIGQDLYFYSKQFNDFEVLFSKEMDTVASSDYELEVVKVWAIPNTDGARVIECCLKLM